MGADVPAERRWPHEPAGFTLISDYGFGDPLPIGQGVSIAGSGGWSINNNGLATRIVDSTAPVSPSFVGQWSYPNGFHDGNDPATMFRTVGGGINELYIGFYWKPSNPWRFHSADNKIAFQFAGGGGAGGQIYISMLADRTLRMVSEFSTGVRALSPNVRADLVTLGQWHLLEIYMNKATRTLRFWLDGVLQGEYANLQYPSQDFDEFKIAPTWGGNTGEIKTEQDYYYFDHVRLSRR